MGVPQIIILVMNAIAIGVSLATHGEKRIKEENFFVTLLSAAMHLGILYWGGFFG